MPPESVGDGYIKWTPKGQIISLGTPSGTALSSMCIALSVVMEHIYHTEEESEHDSLRLSVPNNQSSALISGNLDSNMDNADMNSSQ